MIQDYKPAVSHAIKNSQQQEIITHSLEKQVLDDANKGLNLIYSLHMDIDQYKNVAIAKVGYLWLAVSILGRVDVL